jgi:RNA polymerase sigma-70 factor (ECF subfamily)
MDSRVLFEVMYRAHCQAVSAFVRRRSPASSADDVVAEVFLTAWRRLEDAPDDQLAWLLGIARGVLANRRRSEHRASALRTRLVTEASAGQPGVQDSPEHRTPVMRALEGLGERDREVLLLVAWDGLDRAQAARVIGVTSGTFAVRLHRARRRLARAVAAETTTQQPAGERSSALEVS